MCLPGTEVASPGETGLKDTQLVNLNQSLHILIALVTGVYQDALGKKSTLLTDENFLLYSL